MNSMQHTLREYQHSRRLIEGRIHQLNQEIARLTKEKKPLGLLNQRRYLLYSELVDLDAGIRCINDYLDTGYDAAQSATA